MKRFISKMKSNVLERLRKAESLKIAGALGVGKFSQGRRRWGL